MKYNCLRFLLPLTITLVAGCARNSLPVDSEYSMAAVLLQQQLSTPDSYLSANRKRCPCFVFVGDEDLPPQWLTQLSATGTQFDRGANWAVGKGMRIRIGLPRRRWNGNFDVIESYFCGPDCTAEVKVLMRYNGSNWRVIGTR